MLRAEQSRAEQSRAEQAILCSFVLPKIQCILQIDTQQNDALMTRVNCVRQAPFFSFTRNMA